MQVTRATFVLLCGRMAGAVAAFGIPLILVRYLDVQAFGTYRTLFLIYGSLFVVAQMGMSESLYYFVPRRPEAAARYVLNALTAAAGLAVLTTTAGILAAPAVARWTGNPLIAHTLPLLAIYLGLMLLSSGLEMVMVSRKRYVLASVSYAGTDVVRAAALTLPVLWVASVEALLVGAIAFALLRFAVLAAFLRGEFGGRLRLDRGLWREQWAYALPFGAAVVVEVLQTNLHQYAVLSWFDTATFAIYSVGCLQIPVVEWLSSSAGNVMMVSMAEQVEAGERPVQLWHDTVIRLALVFLPLVCLLVVAAPHLIVLLFTDAYAAAVPVFTVSVLGIVLAALPVDSVLRVFAQTRFIFWMNVARLVGIAASIAWFVGRFGMVGAIAVTVLALAATKGAAVLRIARLLDLSVARVLPWRTLAGTLVAAIGSAAVARAVAGYAGTGDVPWLLWLGTVDGALYLGILAAWRFAPASVRLPVGIADRSL